ncbi:MAG: capsule assembly Wzi family protein [Prevotellaceae bacterium]|nr:capsule assembly Wzi family protein [Prevotellaceae bacterium]
MFIKRIFIFALIMASFSQRAWCQNLGYILDGLDVTTEVQGTYSDEQTPLWLHSNKYGLSSTEAKNGYVRLAAIRPIAVDSTFNWRIGYGVDMAVGLGTTSRVIMNQAFVEGGYKKARIRIGAKRELSPLTNQELSSGALLFGWNALPIPQARLDIDWFSFPGTKGWWKWRLNGSYGMTTDGNWQKGFVNEGERYTNNILYHEKALYWKFGKEDASFPLTYELGLQMVCQFGGTTYNATGRGITGKTDLKHTVNFKAFLDALMATGSDETDGSSKNTAGNHLGSWIMRLKYHGDDWSVAGRFERFFEDQSMMFIQYGLYDHLVGMDITLPSNRVLRNITVEHMSSYDQSGAILHDEAVNIKDKMNGRDNYYNHNLYSGYQHWGEAIGSPLFTSPIYNTDGTLVFPNNRVKAWHIGLAGDPTDWFHWRALATFTTNWGTYDMPLEDKTHQSHFLVEASLIPPVLKGWQIDLGLGLDKGGFLGDNKGVQLTISRVMTMVSE